MDINIAFKNKTFIIFQCGDDTVFLIIKKRLFLYFIYWHGHWTTAIGDIGLQQRITLGKMLLGFWFL